jgi:hypothetical protein
MADARYTLLTAEEARRAERGGDDLIDIGFELTRQDLIYLGLAAYVIRNRQAVQDLPPHYLLAVPFLVNLLAGNDDHSVIDFDMSLDFQDILVLGGLGYAAVKFRK